MQNAIAKQGILAGRRSAFWFLTGAAIVLGGCASIPDAVNPLTWFEDDYSAPPVVSKPGTAADPSAYPKLGSVPKRPSLEQQQAAIGKGLAADNENARYTNDKIQREVERRAMAPRGRASTRVVPPPRPIPTAPRAAAPRVQRDLPRSVSQVPTDRSFVPVAPLAPALGPSVQVATIYFKYGSTRLQSIDQSIIREVAKAQRQTNSIVRVVGHASSRASTFDPLRRHKINLQVSLNRARAVAKALRSLGVPKDRLQVEGKGDTMPVYSEDSPDGEAGNRRAELYFVN